MQNHHSLLEKPDNNINWQQPSQVFNDLVAYYIEGFNSQNFQPLISCKFENEVDDQLVSKPTMSLFP
jgi:hypothetical protein